MGPIPGLHVIQQGRGTPALLFVHGFGCDLDDWGPQFAALSGDFLCTALDLPGHGRSARCAPPSIAGLAGAVNAVRSGLSGDVILIGHSLGAKVVREAACQLPGGLAGLVLIDGGYYAGGAGDKAAADRRLIARDGFDGFVRPHFGALFGAGADPARRAAIVDRAARLEADFGRDVYLSAVEFDITRSAETLRSIAAPILVLQCSTGAPSGGRRALGVGERTPMMDLVAQVVPGADIRIIPDCGHFPMTEQTDILNAALRDFALRCPPTA